MDDVDKYLAEEKERLESMVAPEELHERLRLTLEKTPRRRKIGVPRWIAAVAAILFLSFVSYNYNAFAYYGKKLLGYDELMTDTLSQLNEEGSGQAIEKKVTLSDGTELYLDGLLTDENQSILYYTIKNSEGVTDEPQIYRITGLWTRAFKTHGTFSTNGEETEMKGIQAFEPVSPFAKELTLEYSYNEGTEQGKVTFPYNPKQSMQTELKKSIRKKVHVDQGTIRFDSIIATPSRTTIKAKANVDNFDRIPLGGEGVQLLANGEPVELTGSRAKSGIFGQAIEFYYDRLPTEIETLEIVVDKFVGYQDLNEVIPLSGRKEQSEVIHGEELIIREIEKTAEGIHVTIATEPGILLEGVSIQSNGKTTPLRTTLKAELLERKNGELYSERVLLFQSDDLPDTLSIEGMHYAKRYGEHIQLIGNEKTVKGN